ncbi:serine/arginine-rich splicing factor SC35-like [Camellia sinensis]|uniref:serine/arginine-rich splicing factor SC35-like n=1 Tax=Camellia sinensis TaxID=4442 RepID=UPI001036A13F|nr:serine/arginine-rich splicing factor SC35-like [Camellia sinensis]
MAQGGNGGWIPVMRQRERGGTQGKEDKHGLFIVLVDNLLSAMDAKTLFKLFTQFGIVKDVFIPFKRRTMSNSRFGFVRFDCPVAAYITIQKANGLLVDERVLEVKKANNVKSNRDDQSMRRPHTIKRPPETNKNMVDVSYTGLRLFAEV